MSVIRRILVLTAIAALVAIPSSLPALAQSGTASSVAHRQSVLTDLSPTGEVDTSRIITQLTVEGRGRVEVELPEQSTSGLRNLEGFGGPRVDGDTVHWDVEATPEGTHRRSVADHTGEHPITIDVSYSLDGEAIDPEDLVGRSGTVTVTLDIENVTAEQRDIVVFDGQGRPTTEEMTVAVPIVGSVTATLDGRFLVTDAPGAKIVGDGRGNTVVDWLLVMFSPIGSEQQTVSYTADVTDAVVAPVTATFVPVHAGSFPSLRNSQDAYAAAKNGLSDLTNGALIVDGNVKLLGSGAAQLLDGLVQLRDGAEQLNDGLAGTAAPGAQTLSDGMSQARAGGRELADGLGDLRSGASRLSDGLGSARSGGGRLASGLRDLESGADRLSDGLASAATGGRQLSDGLTTLSAGASRLSAGLTDARTGSVALAAGAASLRDGLKDAAAGTAALAQLTAGLEASFLDSPADLEAAIAGLGDIGGVIALGLATPGIADESVPPGVNYSVYLTQAQAGVTAISAGLQDTLDSLGTSPASCQAAVGAVQTTPPDQLTALTVMKALTCISAQLDTGIRVGTSGSPSAVAGATALADGAADLRDGLVLLDDGASELAAGAQTASRGSGDLASGLVQLNDGAGQLAAGAGTAASGAGDLSSGLVQLDDGAGELASGAGRAASGANDLANGLVQLDDGAGLLANGLVDAADGSGQIAEGLVSAADGGEQIADGTVALSEQGMGAIIDGASAGAAGPSRLLEQANAANTRGRIGDGLPYGTVSGADASAVFRYDIATVGITSDEGPSTALRAGAAVLAFALAGALGFGLRRRFFA